MLGTNIQKKGLYSLKEASEYLGRSVWGLREIIFKGEIPFVKSDRRIFIDINDLNQFIEKNKRKHTY